MEQVQQAQVCDQEMSNVFTFFFETQSVINSVSFALVSLHSEVQSFKYVQTRLVERDKLQRILQPLRFHRNDVNTTPAC